MGWTHMQMKTVSKGKTGAWVDKDFLRFRQYLVQRKSAQIQHKLKKNTYQLRSIKIICLFSHPCQFFKQQTSTTKLV